jgi:hypothetical protein
MTTPHPFDFFDGLRWLDGKPLLDTIERYRRDTFERVLYNFDPDGRPRYDRALIGRAKKNYKTTDLVLAALYRFLVWPSPAGNDCFILANDEGQARDDLDLAKKLIAANPILDREVEVKSREIARRDGRGVLKILPAQDVAGSHGKTYLFIGFDEIHAYKNHDLFEALSPDPTRRDVLTWITSYNTLRFVPGVPLHDMMELGRAGTDPRLYFQWYSADFTTDPALAGETVTPERRANPSMVSWDQPDYLEQQRLRLPTSRFRRLHLNMPGSPEGAAFSAEHVMAAIVAGRRRLPYQPGNRYVAAVDMSGGSNDDATFAVAHKDRETGHAVLDLLVSQSGRPPFGPREAVRKFVIMAHEYMAPVVNGDAYAGQTFRRDFLEGGVNYNVVGPIYRDAKGQPSASDFYEALEPRLNAGEIELLDLPELQEQLLTLVWKGAKITHESGGHDDWANAAAIALILAVPTRQPLIVSKEAVLTSRGLGMNSSRLTPYQAEMMKLAGIPVDETTVDGRPRRINPAAVATSRQFRRAAPGNGDPHRGSVDMLQFARARLGR